MITVLLGAHESCLSTLHLQSMTRAGCGCAFARHARLRGLAGGVEGDALDGGGCVVFFAALIAPSFRPSVLLRGVIVGGLTFNHWQWGAQKSVELCPIGQRFKVS